MLSPSERLRLRRFIAANLVGLLAGVLTLPVLGLTVARSTHLWVDEGILTIAAVLLGVALALLRRGRPGAPVLLILAGNWLVAVGTTVVNPFLISVNLLAALLPLMVTFGFLPRACCG